MQMETISTQRRIRERRLGNCCRGTKRGGPTPSRTERLGDRGRHLVVRGRERREQLGALACEHELRAGGVGAQQRGDGRRDVEEVAGGVLQDRDVLRRGRAASGRLQWSRDNHSFMSCIFVWCPSGERSWSEFPRACAHRHVRRSLAAHRLQVLCQRSGGGGEGSAEGWLEVEGGGGEPPREVGVGITKQSARIEELRNVLWVFARTSGTRSDQLCSSTSRRVQHGNERRVGKSAMDVAARAMSECFCRRVAWAASGGPPSSLVTLVQDKGVRQCEGYVRATL